MSSQGGGSTILIRNGSGSAEPVELQMGEFAINVDTGQLWYGSGSVTSDDEYPFGGVTSSAFTFQELNIKGSLTAEQYIISSSISYITISLSSGSTEFGDTEGDTHRFTGSLFVSGAATSSVIIGDIMLSGSSYHTGSASHTGSLFVKGDTGVTGSSIITGSLVLTGSLLHSGSMGLTGSFTSSGNISASGYISASAFIGEMSGYVSASNIIMPYTNITASIISASGIISASEIWTAGTVPGQISASNVVQPYTNITASNNISASGTVTASAFTGSFVGDGTGLIGTVAGTVSASNIIQPFTNITASIISASGDITLGSNAKFAGTSTGDTQYMFSNVSSVTSNGYSLGFLIVTGSTVDGTVMKISGSGGNSFVGIGTTYTTPLLHALEVVGNISASGFIKTDSNITASGNISASGTVTASAFTGSFVGDGSGLTGTTAGTISASNVVMPFTNITASIISASGAVSTFGEVVHLEGTDPRLKLKAKGANHPGVEWHEDSTRKWVVYNDPDENDNLTFKNDSTELIKISQSGDLLIPRRIIHEGDSDTFIEFTDDDINIKVGGINMLDFTEDSTDEITFNESAQDLDVRIESEADPNLFFTDGNQNRVGIGTNTPGEKLEIIGNVSASGTGSFGMLFGGYF